MAKCANLLCQMIFPYSLVVGELLQELCLLIVSGIVPDHVRLLVALLVLWLTPVRARDPLESFG